MLPPWKYQELGQTAEEAVLLMEHDEYETLHAFVSGYGTPFCRECGDTEEGLMHNNTWRNVEPLMEDLNACSNECVCPTYPVFIDTKTGTWGDANDLVIVYMKEPSDLFDLSDSEIVAYGNENGDAPLLDPNSP